MSLHTRMLFALVLGAMSGVLVNFTMAGEGLDRFVALVTEPIGRVWLNALIMVVIPLVVRRSPSVSPDWVV